MIKMTERIKQLKKEKNAVILAHYYTPDEVQAVADYIGDSFYLSKLATTLSADVICYCGVYFMGESAKALNPEKTILMPDMTADCPMAHMVDPLKINKLKKQYEDLAVVCYINSTAAIKTYADVCVTSSNALKIVKSLPNKYIFFIPDENLGRYIAAQVPEKEFIFNDGYCPVHKEITKENVLHMKQLHPTAKVLAHPECIMEVLETADYIGSTSGILNFAANSSDQEFIIATEDGIFYELTTKNPNKKFYSAKQGQICPDMKKITLEKILSSLETLTPALEMDESLIASSKKPLFRMLELAK